MFSCPSYSKCIKKLSNFHLNNDNDVRTIKETLKNGCTMCHIWLPEIVQFEEQIAEQVEEAVLNFLDEKDTK